MTSLAVFHLTTVSRIWNLDRRGGSNVPGEAAGAGLPLLLARAQGDVDLAPESLLGALGGVVDLVAIRPAEQEYVDVVGRQSGFAWFTSDINRKLSDSRIVGSRCRVRAACAWVPLVRWRSG